MGRQICDAFPLEITPIAFNLDITDRDWFAQKEEENADRRKAITSKCSTLDSNVKEVMEKSVERLFLSEKHKMAYC